LKNKKKRGQTCTLIGRDRERDVGKKKKNNHRQQVVGPPLTHSTLGGRACGGVLNDTIKDYF